MSAPSQDSITERFAAFMREQDRLQHALHDAIGRVVARTELYDEALADETADAGQSLHELVKRCRELVTAQRAFEKWFQQNTRGSQE